MSKVQVPQNCTCFLDLSKVLAYISLLHMTIFSSHVSLQKHGNDLDMTALWLKNAYLLHDLLTQYSPKEVGHTCIDHAV